ncbi:MAG: carbohydrate kinase family protein, partial [Chloroflexi bacterium]|nr:carbohydrate kinase family protein [Chloroflexota bacterium]
MTIFVSGSIAYDRIMDFPGYFSEHILPEKLHVLNVSFTVNGLKEEFGGTAGNIAYALRLLGENPVILATIGRDCQGYFEWLRKNGISHDHIKVIEKELTACAYITTDKADNQITGFNPGAMKYPSSFQFDTVDASESIAIIAPGNLQDMMGYSRACCERGIRYIFDPGQSLPMWDGADLARCIDGSLMLVSNDYELEMVINKTGLDKHALLERTQTIITTLGEMGSRVSTREQEIAIPAVKPGKVVDPTGAGDAYRAGLLSGLVKGKDIEQCAMMGSVCASFAIEEYGTQTYSFTMQKFNERLDAISSPLAG